MNLADLGEIAVKNIARPVRAFQVLREGETPAKVAAPRRRRVWIAAAAAVLVAGGGYWYMQRPDFQPANTANFANLRKFQRYKDQDYKERWLATLARLGLPEE